MSWFEPRNKEQAVEIDRLTAENKALRVAGKALHIMLHAVYCGHSFGNTDIEKALREWSATEKGLES